MQSSPPTRAWERPASPAESQYSIDLAALDLDSHSGASSPAPKQHVDQVLSEDIDGPSDFTQNMEAWMRGGTLKKQNTLKSGLQPLLQESKEHERDTPNGDGRLTPGLPDEEPSLSHHTPSNSPPKESVFHEHQADQEGEEGSSDWDPYAEAATPHPPPHKQLLQPTVEDCCSELTPARAYSAHLPQSTRRKSSVAESCQHSPSNSEPSTPGRPSSETISPVRSPVFQRSVPRQFSSQTNEASFEQQMQELREKCQRVEDLNANLSHALDEERRMRKEETATHEAQMADAARRERDLTEMKEEAYTDKEGFRREFREMKERLQGYEKEQDGGRKEIERLKREHDADLRKLAEEHDRKRAKYDQEVRPLEYDLDLARRSRDEAEESARALREELDEYRDAHDADMDRMQLRLDESDGLRDQISELEDQVRILTLECDNLKSEQRAANETANHLIAEMSLLRQTKDEETARLTLDHRRTVDLGEDLRAQLNEALRQLGDEQAAHEEELERLQNEHKEEHTRPTDDLARLREEIETKQTDLNTAILERDAARDELESQQSALNSATLDRDAANDSLQSMQAELDATKLQLTDLEAVNSALDARVSGAVRRREAYWRGRLEEVEDERRVMVKALMRQWGREEVGVEDPQAYAYMFLQKTTRGKGKS